MHNPHNAHPPGFQSSVNTVQSLEPRSVTGGAAVLHGSNKDKKPSTFSAHAVISRTFFDLQLVVFMNINSHQWKAVCAALVFILRLKGVGGSCSARDENILDKCNCC